MLAYRVTIDASPHCERSAIDHTAFPTLIQQSTDRMYESKYFYNTRRLDLHFHGPSPYGPSTPWLNGWRGLELSFMMDNMCRRPMTVSIHLDIYGSLGRWLKRIDMVVLAFPFAIIFGILYMQLKQWSNTSKLLLLLLFN
jgi:hypothetical protein